jgi:hypothetical protein
VTRLVRAIKLHEEAPLEKALAALLLLWPLGKRLLVVPANLPHELIEGLVNVDLLLGRGFNELAAKVLGEVLALLHGDLAVVFQITLVTHNDDGEVVLVLNTENLLVEGGDLVKAVPGGDGVDAEETLSGPHVLLSHGGVLLLSGGVEHIQQGDLLVNDTLLPVAVLNGRVILVNKVGLDELDRQSRLAHTLSSHQKKKKRKKKKITEEEK